MIKELSIGIYLQAESLEKDSYGHEIWEHVGYDYGFCEKAEKLIRADDELCGIAGKIVDSITARVKHAKDNYHTVISYGDEFKCKNSVYKCKDSESGHIYIVSAVGTGFVKIGITKAGGIGKRIHSLQNGCPHDLELVGLFESCDYKRAEFLAHTRIFRNRVRGEWFKCSIEDAVDTVRIALEETDGEAKEVCHDLS